VCDDNKVLEMITAMTKAQGVTATTTKAPTTQK
jgi:hypothetical protein